MYGTIVVKPASLLVVVVAGRKVKKISRQVREKKSEGCKVGL
jgi:hypothetical protein